MGIRLVIDREARAAYITLRDDEVARTCQVTESVLVDLDNMGVVVGVEVLSLTAKIPFTELHEKFHVHSDTIEALRIIQPTVSSFLMMHAADGVSTVRPREQAHVH